MFTPWRVQAPEQPSLLLSSPVTTCTSHLGKVGSWSLPKHMGKITSCSHGHCCSLTTERLLGCRMWLSRLGQPFALCWPAKVRKGSGRPLLITPPTPQGVKAAMCEWGEPGPLRPPPLPQQPSPVPACPALTRIYGHGRTAARDAALLKTAPALLGPSFKQCPPARATQRASDRSTALDLFQGKLTPKPLHKAVALSLWSRKS